MLYFLGLVTSSGKNSNPGPSQEQQGNKLHNSVVNFKHSLITIVKLKLVRLISKSINKKNSNTVYYTSFLIDKVMDEYDKLDN